MDHSANNRGRRGAQAIEYGLLIGLIAGAVFLALGSLGLKELYQNTAGKLVIGEVYYRLQGSFRDVTGRSHLIDGDTWTMHDTWVFDIIEFDPDGEWAICHGESWGWIRVNVHNFSGADYFCPHKMYGLSSLEDARNAGDADINNISSGCMESSAWQRMDTL